MSVKMFWSLGPGGQSCGTAPKGGAVGVGVGVEVGAKVEMTPGVAVGIFVVGILVDEQLLTITKSARKNAVSAVAKRQIYALGKRSKLNISFLANALGFLSGGCILSSRNGRSWFSAAFIFCST